MLMLPKKGEAVATIMGKLSGSSTSENTSEELKKKNENSMEQISLASRDEPNQDSAVEAASQSLLSAFQANDTKSVASAVRDLFNLFELESDSKEEMES